MQSGHLPFSDSRLDNKACVYASNPRDLHLVTRPSLKLCLKSSKQFEIAQTGKCNKNTIARTSRIREMAPPSLFAELQPSSVQCSRQIVTLRLDSPGTPFSSRRFTLFVPSSHASPMKYLTQVRAMNRSLSFGLMLTGVILAVEPLNRMWQKLSVSSKVLLNLTYCFLIKIR